MNNITNRLLNNIFIYIDNLFFKNLRLKLWVALLVLIPIWILIYVYGVKEVEFTSNLEVGYYKNIELSRLLCDCMLSLIGAMFGTVITITFIDRLHSEEGTENAKPLFENIIRNFGGLKDKFIAATRFSVDERIAEDDLIPILDYFIKNNIIINPNQGGGAKNNFRLFREQIETIKNSINFLPEDAKGKSQLGAVVFKLSEDFNNTLYSYWTSEEKNFPEKEKKKLLNKRVNHFLMTFKNFCVAFNIAKEFI